MKKTPATFKNKTHQKYRKDIVFSSTKEVSTGSKHLDLLGNMFTYCRPAGTESETEFLMRFAIPFTPTLIDEGGGLHFDRRQNETNRTLFTAHSDTVHRTAGRQEVYFDAKKQILHTEGECLGADDAAGIAMLLHLMESGVPAYYIITRSEEVGGIHARYLANELSHILADFDRAIAFDRRNTYSVITHQGGRCASDEFAEALCDQLNAQGMMYMPDDGGVYTDTAEFVDIIPECTNLSVGYMHEHTTHETLDYAHFAQLAEAVVKIDWDALPVSRQPYSGSAYDVDFQFEAEGYEAGDVPSFDKVEVAQALEAALIGQTGDILLLVAMAVLPEDIDAALRWLDYRYLNNEVIRDALDALNYSDPYSILMSIYDEIASEPEDYYPLYS